MVWNSPSGILRTSGLSSVVSHSPGHVKNKLGTELGILSNWMRHSHELRECVCRHMYASRSWFGIIIPFERHSNLPGSSGVWLACWARNSSLEVKGKWCSFRLPWGFREPESGAHFKGSAHCKLVLFRRSNFRLALWDAKAADKDTVNTLFLRENNFSWNLPSALHKNS